MINQPEDSLPPDPDSHLVGVPATSRISSPASTGGGGTFFEQHVNAYWLTQLLVGAIPPILHDCVVAEVHLQTEHLGWHTDDFAIVGQNGSGGRRQLAGQVKRTVTVSATDEEFKKAVLDFWKDFGNPQLFSRTSDRLVLVILRGTTTVLKDLSGLLDYARVTRDGGEFERALSVPGFLSKQALKYCDELRTIIGGSEGRSVSAADVWSFLRVLHVLSLDLNTSTRQTEAMMKTLLAHTTHEQDVVGVAEATWNALLTVVGEGMPEARSFRRDDLPEQLRLRHSPVGGAEQRALRSLHDHSNLILDGIRSTIGGTLHLSRGQLVQKVLDKLESAQVVVVAGPAGSGKSGIAKDVITTLSADHFAFSFRAEEFASPHFDATLQRSQIPASAKTMGALLAGQGRKALLVESVERLLEASTRDAFADLLTLVAADPSWRLVLTCRDYSVDLVRTGLLEVARIGHTVVTVPPLVDEELRVVETAFPTLARPLGNSTLRGLFRNPYFLDKALQINWSDDRPLPVSEREFRARFWEEIVRAESCTAQGMPHRREDVFVQVALRRARALTPYASCGDLDPQVLDALRHDSLLVSSPDTRILVAPAHDVLEDWAVLHWLQEQFVVSDGAVIALCSVLGTCPAIRRTYRKWVSELAEVAPQVADSVFGAAIQEDGLSPQFRDDTLVSLLRADASVAFLERHSGQLFANNKELLRRVIHLLRVACVTTPAWLETASARPSLFNVPEGSAWACVLRLIRANLTVFTAGDTNLLLALVEDWARGVSWDAPYPQGSDHVAGISHWLLAWFSNYLSDEQRKRTLKVIAKIPNGDRERFAALLQEDRGEERDYFTEDILEIIFEGIEGMPAARDMPEAIVAAAKAHFLCTDFELDRDEERGYTADLGLEILFGIKGERGHGFFPASAYRGPFLSLLRHHPRQGLNLIIDVINHSADWYAHPRVRSVEPPYEISLSFSDGTMRTQWCNARLWDLYRGTSVGPPFLESMLMALERWLMEYAGKYPRLLDEALVSILRRSDSGALTAVVTSVATAFPHLSGETLLVLLSSPNCIRLDRQRMAAESQAPSKLPLPRLNDRNRVYEEERQEADTLSHRQHDLEMAIANLQLGPLATRVHQLLDRHRAEMRPIEEQHEEDRVWRLALHRMDLRQYSVSKDASEDLAASEGKGAPSDGGKYVRLDLNVPDPDVKEMADQSAQEFQAVNARLGLMLWGLNVFRYEGGKQYDPTEWHERLRNARAVREALVNADDYQPGRDGPAFVAAVCVRDHWEEISNDERAWCVDVICSEIQRHADTWSDFARGQRNSMEGDRPSALVLPLLLGKEVDEAVRRQVRQLLAAALTHAIDEVRWHSAWGVATHLWDVDRDLSLRCVNAIAMEATLLKQAFSKEDRRKYSDRRQAADMAAEVASVIRKRFNDPDGISANAHQALDPTDRFGAEANSRILVILGQAPNEARSVAAFKRVAATIAQWWDSDDDRRQSRGHRYPDRSYEDEAALADLLDNFVLQTTSEDAAAIMKPILEAVDRHPDKVHWRLLGLLSIEDRQPDPPRFWALWKLFADKVKSAKWLSRLDGEYSFGDPMILAIFLVTRWKDGVGHWRSLEGFAGLVDALFEDLPPSSVVLDAYVRFLYEIGQHSLPQAFVRIARRLRKGDSPQMLRKGNTVFMLEVLLQRYVYGRPLELKRQSELREAVLSLLDLLVEHGSSAAFRMRDDFVTPLSIT